MLDAQLARRPEVQVDAGQAGGFGREADEHRRAVQGAQQRQAPVVELDVHHDQRVHEGGVRDPAQPVLALLLGEQQHVVVVPARGRHHGHRELHHHRDMDAGP